MDQLPSPPVQTLPFALLSFLGIKNGGRNPSPLNQGVSAVLDLFRFYAANATNRGADVIAIPVGGGLTPSTFYVVPTNRVWLVTSFIGFWGNAGAVPYTNPYIQIIDQQNLTHKIFSVGNPQSPATGGSGTPFGINDPFFMLPGWRVAAGHSGPGTATATNLSLQMDVFEFNT